MKKIKVNLISESEFTVKGHGVHTAFTENFQSLKKIPNVDIKINSNRKADIVHIQTIGPYSLKKLLTKNGKKVITAHVVPSAFVGTLRGAKLWSPLAKVYLKNFYNLADVVLAVSKKVADDLKELGVNKPIQIFHNTINTEKYILSSAKKKNERIRLKIPSSSFVVIANGQFLPLKRVDTFIKCAKALPKIKFIWVGGLPFKNLATDYGKMKKIMKNAPNNVFITGIVPHAEVAKYYWASDLFFLPSDRETFGIVIVEAAASGLPVLLRDNTQYRDTFNGWYARGQEKNFIKLIKRFRDDKKFYNFWKKEATHIAHEYDSTIGAKKLVKLYYNLLQK